MAADEQEKRVFERRDERIFTAKSTQAIGHTLVARVFHRTAPGFHAYSFAHSSWELELTHFTRPKGPYDRELLLHYFHERPITLRMSEISLVICSSRLVEFQAKYDSQTRRLLLRADGWMDDDTFPNSLKD